MQTWPHRRAAVADRRFPAMMRFSGKLGRNPRTPRKRARYSSPVSVTECPPWHAAPSAPSVTKLGRAWLVCGSRAKPDGQCRGGILRGFGLSREQRRVGPVSRDTQRARRHGPATLGVPRRGIRVTRHANFAMRWRDVAVNRRYGVVCRGEIGDGVDDRARGHGRIWRRRIRLSAREPMIAPSVIAVIVARVPFGMVPLIAPPSTRPPPFIATPLVVPSAPPPIVICF